MRYNSFVSTPRSPSTERVDSELLLQLSAISPGAQRWLKAALLAVDSLEGAGLEATRTAEAPPARRPGPRRPPAPGLDDLISGGASLDEQIEAYPELAEELRGLGDIADLLRETGRSRRQKGEEILRQSQEPETSADEDKEEREAPEEDL